MMDKEGRIGQLERQRDHLSRVLSTQGRGSGKTYLYLNIFLEMEALSVRIEQMKKGGYDERVIDRVQLRMEKRHNSCV